MNELTEFKYVNDNLTTIPQARLISKIASHFKIPQKVMREAIDLDPKRFANSKFMAEYALMLADRRRGFPYFVVYDKELFILISNTSIKAGDGNIGGIFIQHSPHFLGDILVPLQPWLKLFYPLPSLD